eukprot:403361409
MQIILAIHATLAILKMFIINPYASIGDIISCLILYCGINQHNFCTILVYMIFCLFNAFQLATMIGFLIQTGAFGSGLSSNGISIANGNGLNMGFVYGFTIIMFTFYILAVYCSFQAYKEFKAIYQEQIGMDRVNAFAGIRGGPSYGGTDTTNDQRNQNRDRQLSSAYTAFQGEGKRLGDY